MPDRPADRMRPRLWLPLVLVAAGAAAYANSFAGTFAFDDFRAIHDNAHLRHPFASWRWMLASGRPVVMATFAANVAVSDLRPWSYHAINLAAHLAAGLALFGLARRTLLSPTLRDRYGAAADGLAFAVALLWLVHPLQTESVTYVVQRAEGLMGLFYLLTLYGLARGAAAEAPGRWYAAAVLACALGMGSKEVMVTAPVVALLYDRTFLAGTFREALRRRRALYAALAATWAVLAVPVQVAFGLARDAGGGGTGFRVKGLTSLDYALSQPGVVLHYLRLAFWPSPLCLDYGWPVARTPADIMPPLLAVLALLVLTCWAIWRRPALGFLGAAFFLVLAPSSSVVPIVDLAFEHRTYLPLAAVATAVVLAGYEGLAVAWQRLGWGGQTRTAVAGAMLAATAGALAAGTVARNNDYRSEVALWESTMAARPQNPRAWLNLGMALARPRRPGAREPTRDLGRAVEVFRAAVRRFPDDAEVVHALGYALDESGQTDEAGRCFERALTLDPNHRACHNNLGRVLFRQGKKEEAVAHFEAALRLDPDDAVAHLNLGQALVSLGRVAEAIPHYRAALALGIPAAGPLLRDAERRLGAGAQTGAAAR